MIIFKHTSMIRRCWMMIIAKKNSKILNLNRKINVCLKTLPYIGSVYSGLEEKKFFTPEHIKSIYFLNQRRKIRKKKFFLYFGWGGSGTKVVEKHPKPLNFAF